MIGNISHPDNTSLDWRPLLPHPHPLLTECTKNGPFFNFSCSYTVYNDNSPYHVLFAPRNRDQPHPLFPHTLLDLMAPTPRVDPFLAEN